MPSYRQIGQLLAPVKGHYLVVGGTAGLGKAACIALAKQKASVSVGGRNRDKALAVLSELIMTAGRMQLDRSVNAQGLDTEMCIHFYGRWILARELLNNLEPGSRITSVLAAGQGMLFVPDDLKLEKSINFIRARTVAAGYTDVIVKAWSQRFPNYQFNHIFPGLVNTELSQGLPWPISSLAKLFGFLLTPAQSAGDSIALAATHLPLEKPYNLIGPKCDLVPYPDMSSWKGVEEHMESIYQDYLKL